MAHLDVKKVGRIPDGGGWRVHGRDSDHAKAAGRANSAGAKRGYVYLHSIIDGFSRLAYTEPLADEKGTTAAAFLARAKVWFAAHGITQIHRVVTDNGACYRSGDFARIIGNQTRHQKTKPYTPRHNGKVERYQRILAEELLYARELTASTQRHHGYDLVGPTPDGGTHRVRWSGQPRLRDERQDCLRRLGQVLAELVEAPHPPLEAADQPGVFELGEVMADGGLAEVEGGREVAHADRFGGSLQQVEHLHAGRVGERPEEGRQVVRLLFRK